MPPVPTKSIKTEKPQQVSVSTANVYNEYGQSLDEILQKEKMRQFHQKNQTDEQIRSATQATDTQEGEYIYGDGHERYRSVVFKNIISEGKYRLTFDNLAWLEESESSLEIGYNSDGEFTVVESYDSETLPENKFFFIELPEDTAIESIEVRMKGGYTTVHIENDKLRSATQATDTQDGEYIVQNEEKYRSVVFANVISEGKYRLTFDSLAWLQESGSTLEIGYNSGGVFTSIESYSSASLPEENFFFIELPDATAIESIEVLMKGGYTIVHIENVTDTESCVHYDKAQELEDEDKEMARHNITAMIDLLDEDVELESEQQDTVRGKVKAMIDLLDSGVTLTTSEQQTILTKLGLGDVLTRLENAESNIRSLGSDISSAESSISSLEGTVSDHESRITALESAPEPEPEPSAS